MRLRLLALCLLTACDPAPSPDAGPGDVPSPDAWTDPGVSEVRFDLAGVESDFFAFPFPSDLRLEADGTPDLTGYPNPRSADILEDLLLVADERPGWPVVPHAQFRFSAPLAERSVDDTIPAEASAPILLLDVDPDSPDRGALFPVVAETMPFDRSAGYDLLGVAPRPGIVLRPGRTYAFVVRTAANDWMGRPLGVEPTLATLAAGETPSAPWGADAAALYAPLFATLDTLGVPRAEVAAATVFTTGDVVERVRRMSDAVLAAHDVTIEDLALDPEDGVHERYCELLGTVSMPQFQAGTPLFDTEGRFVLDAAGTPIEQRREDVPVVVTIPRAEMPAEGWPLLVYFHGSGGLASQVVDRGPYGPDGVWTPGEGPAHVVAAHGLAAVGAALPVSPDRVPGASGIAYINLGNLAAFPSTFQQGAFEQRLLIEAMTRLSIPPAALAACSGATLPAGETAHHFDASAFVGMGQSMGGMYTNMIGAIEPLLSALVPTGAGGYWSYFILQTALIPNAADLIGNLIGADGDTLTQLHPGLSLLQLGWESADPIVYVPRLSRRPLPGLTPRPIYEPVGLSDSYFTTTVYDAMALAYGHEQAGAAVWPTMQEVLALGGLEGATPYPVSGNVTSDDGTAYTGVVVQYAPDGFDGHDIFQQLDEVKYQYGCFLSTFLTTGTAVVPAPMALGTPCPTRM